MPFGGIPFAAQAVPAWSDCAHPMMYHFSGKLVDGTPPIESPVLLATWHGDFSISNVLVEADQDWTIRVLTQYLCDIPAVE